MRGDDEHGRDQQEPEAEEQARLLHVHRRRRREDLTPCTPPRDPERRSWCPGRLDHHERDQPEDGGNDEKGRCGAPQERAQRLGAFLDAGAEEVGGARSEDASRRDAVAAVTPVLGPFDRRRPLRLHVGAGRPVEERLLELAPPSLEGDPREGVGRRSGIAGDGQDGRPDLPVRAARVVAADPGLGRAAEVEGLRELVRVRSGRRVDDRMRAVDDLELLFVVPGSPLGPLVRAVPDLDRLLARAPPPRRPRRRRAGSSPSRPRGCC